MVVGHENNLRGLLMHLEGISEARIPELEIPRAVPLRYHVRVCVRPTRSIGVYAKRRGRVPCCSMPFARSPSIESTNPVHSLFLTPPKSQH